MVNTRHDSNPFPRFQDQGVTGTNRNADAIPPYGQSAPFGRAFRMARPKLDGQASAPADDILRFLAMGVQRGHLAAMAIHQLFTIFRLLAEVDKNQPGFVKTPEPQICDIPAGFGRKSPSGRSESPHGFLNGEIDPGAFHRTAQFCAPRRGAYVSHHVGNRRFAKPCARSMRWREGGV